MMSLLRRRTWCLPHRLLPAAGPPRAWVRRELAIVPPLSKKDGFPRYTNADMMRLLQKFCARYDVHFVVSYVVLGTPKRTLHACKMELPLPAELQNRAGFRRLFSKGEVTNNKVKARYSAVRCGFADPLVVVDVLRRPRIRVMLRRLAGDLSVDLAELDDTQVERQKEEVKRGAMPEVIQRALLRERNEAAVRAVLVIALLAERLPTFARHKTITQKGGGVLLVNARVTPIGVNKSEIVSKVTKDGVEMMTADGDAVYHYDELEYQVLLACPGRLRGVVTAPQRKEARRIEKILLNDETTLTRAHAELVVYMTRELTSELIGATAPLQRALEARFLALKKTKIGSSLTKTKWAASLDAGEPMTASAQRPERRPLPIDGVEGKLVERLRGSHLAFVQGGASKS